MHDKVPCSVRLKKASLIRNMKQVDLCEKTKIKRSAMSQYFKGTFEPKADGIYLLAEALNVSEAWLMGYDVPMEKEKPTIDSELVTALSDPDLLKAYEMLKGLSSESIKKVQEHIELVRFHEQHNK